MLRSVDLRDYMIDNPVEISKDAGIMEAVHLILVNKISGLCVVDDDHKLVGVLSELDCLDGILKASYNDSGIGKVEDVMSTDLVVASQGEDIVDVASDMLKTNSRRRPVVENGKLIGQITCRQLLRAVKEFSVPKDKREY
ncbi:protein-inosine monophosphate dehydrogenase [Motiliproteus sp. MSK22-1]|nr:protein-inosine monophosphate dehydrogenase [Motiliproteus sp. MSK22-1]